ncbi:hypothetical protein BV898_14689 [Hypsibius exemplaris]|uniref:G-protein coupled receptors family 1 profile domain-containing protein n=1 Tax=Hypsibius exemplaris TaxID=2072580 RepID=A0A9X6RJQ4_HYPEX|nr:hypothetical protein BV898_14689 [Hypsibius exemplaris]
MFLWRTPPPRNADFQLPDHALLNVTSCNWPQDPHFNETMRDGTDFYVKAILYPIILTLSTCGNTLTLLVLGTDPRKTTTHVYLMCIAFFDLTTLWLELFNYLHLVSPQRFKPGEQNVRNSVNVYGFLTFWQEVCVQSSDWTLIAFSIERICATAKPLYFRRFETVMRAVYTEVAIVLMAAICYTENLVVWYHAIKRTVGGAFPHPLAKEKYLSPALLRWDHIQIQAMVSIAAVNWVTILSLNISLMAVLHHRKNIRQTLFSADSSSSYSSRPTAATPILLACGALYSSTMSLPLVCIILVIAGQPPYCSYHTPPKIQTLLNAFGTMSLLVNYSAGFLLYCWTWRKFRNRFQDILTAAFGRITCRPVEAPHHVPRRHSRITSTVSIISYP